VVAYRYAKAPFVITAMARVIDVPEIGTAVLLVILTLWLQCAGLAALIVWARRAVAGISTD